MSGEKKSPAKREIPTKSLGYNAVRAFTMDGQLYLKGAPVRIGELATTSLLDAGWIVPARDEE